MQILNASCNRSKCHWPTNQSILTDLSKTSPLSLSSSPSPSSSPGYNHHPHRPQPHYHSPNISQQLAVTRSYLEKMTNCGLSGQTASRDNSVNHHEQQHQPPTTTTTTPTSTPTSQPSFHSHYSSNHLLVPIDHSNPVGGHHTHHPHHFDPNSLSKKILSEKCENLCPSFNSILQTVRLNSENSNRSLMNTLNPDNLLSPDTKHLFGGSSGCGVSGIPGASTLTGHLNHTLGSTAVNTAGLSMTVSSHLHHQHGHHPAVHPSTLHSMSSPTFTIHSHLTVSAGQRRLSTNSNNPSSRSSRTSSQINNNNKQFLCPMCNKFFTQKGNFLSLFSSLFYANRVINLNFVT